MRLIDADALSVEMFDEAFEKDSDLQKWDGGCWIRYKLFENTIRRQPTIDAVPVVRCGECKHHEDEEPGMVYCPNTVGGWVKNSWFCADGERREDGK